MRSSLGMAEKRADTVRTRRNKRQMVIQRWERTEKQLDNMQKTDTWTNRHKYTVFPEELEGKWRKQSTVKHGAECVLVADPCLPGKVCAMLHQPLSHCGSCSAQK